MNRLRNLFKPREGSGKVGRANEVVVEKVEGGGDTDKFKRRYPWDTWLNQRSITLYQGVDFNGQTWYFGMHARRMATKRGYDLSIHMSEDGLSITLTPTKKEGK